MGDLCVMTKYTFQVDRVEKAVRALPTDIAQNVITSHIEVMPESCFNFPDSLNPVHAKIVRNSFVSAVHAAYSMHYPLVLSPDMLWQCVAQGFAIHVNQNSDTLRQKFVAHKGKKVIEVRRDLFVKGSAKNDWEGAFGEFSDKIRKNIGDEIHSLLTPEFSTTGAVERAAAQVVMMDAFKEYFTYRLLTMCGIPEITLQGTVEDWEALREKTRSLARFDLKWWTDPLEPILTEFVSAASGKPNTEFWKTIYKVTNGSGGTHISGWITALFPYFGSSAKNMRRNSCLDIWGSDRFWGVSTADFPSGSVSTPFKWLYLGAVFEMYFYAGFLGVGQDKKSLALQPVVGWAVVDKEEEEKANMMSTSRAPLDYGDY